MPGALASRPLKHVGFLHVLQPTARCCVLCYALNPLGRLAQVHYDCVYKGLDVVSSRQARLLGGNRTISEPFEFVAGAAVAGASPTRFVDSAGGLFSGQGGPTPPPALSTSVIGMRAGGKVRPRMQHMRCGQCELRRCMRLLSNDIAS